ncbi:molybdopterin-dependent oxidoreductase [Curtobacterium sp. MCBD17_035]|uniref:molybdopterin-dependent oxidoreductase n=1 Tax=Curtobacterium sp. MCBD17_035 TaxID=2175673 RepID=UPI0021AC783D|nr:molybdopterin-dependent oxidoreductase [Curtobacterium sp. MCBD17_035]WIB66879.1 molybdopterin-dependent oxidoreductase [Curtobacterium sp. MCBD17_035]
MNAVRRLLRDLRRGLASPNRNARSAVVLGRLLGIAFLVCFATGLWSHFLQDPLPWMTFPTQPARLYQFTQGLHITTGIAIIPLLFAKLNTVMPALVQDPPLRGPVHLLERASITVFVSAAVVQVLTGLVNTYQWYPWPFSFRQTHYALSYVLIGSLAIHIGAKLPLIVRYWRARDSYDAEGRFVVDPAVRSELVPDPVPAGDGAAPVHAGSGREARHPSAAPTRGVTGRLLRWIDADPGGPRGRVGDGDQPPAASQDGRRQRLARRGFFTAVGGAVAAVVVLTVGQSSRLGEPFTLFAPRQRGLGPAGLPVNRTAHAAGVTETARAGDWGLTVSANGVRKRFSRADLRAMDLVTVELPIACVEGWSQMATWRGVRIRDLVRAVGAPAASTLRVTSLERHGGYRVMEMGAEYAADPTTLVALEVNGADLPLDHGYPARIIAPGRPGVLQTKWLSSIEVTS